MADPTQFRTVGLRPDTAAAFRVGCAEAGVKLIPSADRTTIYLARA